MRFFGSLIELHFDSNIDILNRKKFDNLSSSINASQSKSTSSSSSLAAARKYSTNIEPMVNLYTKEIDGFSYFPSTFQRRDYRAYGDYFTERDNRVIQKLREENSSLKEIVEMERLVGM